LTQASSKARDWLIALPNLLEHSQFSHHRLDADLAAKFLDRYLDSLDPAHLLFLAVRCSEFDHFRSHLADMTRREGDLALRSGSSSNAIWNDWASAPRMSRTCCRMRSFHLPGTTPFRFDRTETPRPQTSMRRTSTLAAKRPG
jgi:hypothetical protein